MRRQLVVAILTLSMLAGLSGCAKKPPEKSINTQALEYMEQKYGEKFEYAYPYGDSMTGTHQLLVTCESYPDQLILVSIENYRTDNKVFLDNFIAVKYRDETVDFIQTCASQVYGDSTVFYRVTRWALSPELPVNATFAEFLTDPKARLNIMLEVKASDYVSVEQTQQFAELLAAYGTEFYVSVVFVNDDEFGTFDDETLEKQMSTRSYTHCAKITHLGGVIKIRWLEDE